jgi:threonine dehydratase
MPSNAVVSKIDATRGYGGTVVLTEGSLMEACLDIQKKQKLTFVHPFDDRYIIAGQATVALEIMQELPDVDAAIVSIGGGGLISGIAAVLKSKNPDIKIFGVEPEGACAMLESLNKSEAVHLDSVHTVADGLAAPFAGELTLRHVQHFVDDVVLVSDTSIIEAMKLMLERIKIIAEPAGAATLAAILAGKLKLKPESSVVCILSGGNIDHKRLKQFL